MSTDNGSSSETPNEKIGAVGEAEVPSTSPEAPGFDERETKKLLRKLDFHLVPFLALLYL